MNNSVLFRGVLLTALPLAALASDDAPMHNHVDMNAQPMDMAMPMPAAPATTPGVHNDRDPNAYADGYTLQSGPFVPAGMRRLHMADEHAFWAVLFDRFEYVDADGGNAAAYDAKVWYGTTYDRTVLKAEGDVIDGALNESRTELLWGHAVAPFWDTQLGARHDSSRDGPDRSWLAFGVEGLAPYWFDIEVTGYIGEQGRTALRAQASYELLFTQRLILQPRVELNAYGRNDAAAGNGSGLSDSAVGLRLRYEFSRRFAPYVGVEWRNKYATGADYARRADQSVHDTQWVAGLRFWF